MPGGEIQRGSSPVSLAAVAGSRLVVAVARVGLCVVTSRSAEPTDTALSSAWQYLAASPAVVSLRTVCSAVVVAHKNPV